MFIFFTLLSEIDLVKSSRNYCLNSYSDIDAIGHFFDIRLPLSQD